MDSVQEMTVRPIDIDDVDLKIGFLGAGKMAQALCAGFIRAGEWISYLVLCHVTIM